MSEVNLKAKVQVSGRIRIVTGLAIGGSGGTLEIGGVDQTIIRNPLNNEPFIPGSSLKGKLRSLLEKFLEKEQNYKVSKEPNLIRIHRCESEEEYNNCVVCMIFGSSEKDISKPSRLIVRDASLMDGTEYSKKDLKEKGDLPFSELKTETVIDRITAQAMPRVLERVPAGAEFNLDLIFDLYNKKDVEFFSYLFSAMKLLEDDYLGGSGTRGSGQIMFDNLVISIKEGEYYNSGELKAEFKSINKGAKSTEEVLGIMEDIQNQLRQLF